MRNMVQRTLRGATGGRVVGRRLRPRLGGGLLPGVGAGRRRGPLRPPFRMPTQDLMRRRANARPMNTANARAAQA